MIRTLPNKPNTDLANAGPSHAVDELEVVLRAAIEKGFHSISFTEHMPRESDDDLYPAETSVIPLWPRHHAYLLEATRLREKYAISHRNYNPFTLAHLFP
jgi:histidinol phosphatase-like PHP family hydrolase